MGKQALNDINEHVVNAAGLEVHCRVPMDICTPPKDQLKDWKVAEVTCPRVKPKHLTHDEVKH